MLVVAAAAACHVLRCAAIPVGQGRHSEQSSAALAAIDCEARQLAWEFAQDRLNGTCLPIRRVYDALRLADCSGRHTSSGSDNESQEGHADSQEGHTPARACGEWGAFGERHEIGAKGGRREEREEQANTEGDTSSRGHAHPHQPRSDAQVYLAVVLPTAPSTCAFATSSARARACAHSVGKRQRHLHPNGFKQLTRARAQSLWQRALTQLQLAPSVVRGSSPTIFGSVHEALAASRRAAPRPAHKFIVLCGGVHLLGHRGAVQMSARDSNTTIVALAGERVVLSGGVMIFPDWKPATACAHARQREGVGAGAGGESDGASGERDAQTCWKARIEEQLPSAHAQPDFDFNQLFLPGFGGGTRAGGRRERSVPDTHPPDVYSRRAVRARHPNADPEVSGLHTVPSGYMPRGSARWLPEVQTPPAREVRRKGVRNHSLFPDYQMGFGGPAAAFKPKSSYWAVAHPPGGGGATFKRVGGLVFDPQLLQPLVRGDEEKRGGGGGVHLEGWEDAVVHAFHGQYWGNWQYALNASSDIAGGRLEFAEGGWQEARGSAGAGGADWYLENSRMLLDAHLEWFYERGRGVGMGRGGGGRETGVLYMVVNGTSPPPYSLVAGGLSEVLAIGVGACGCGAEEGRKGGRGVARGVAAGLCGEGGRFGQGGVGSGSGGDGGVGQVQGQVVNVKVCALQCHCACFAGNDAYVQYH